MIPELGTGEGIGYPFQFSWAYLVAQLVENLSAAHSAGDLGSLPGEGKGYLLQYSGLENSVDCIVRGFAKSRTRATFTFTFQWLDSVLGPGASTFDTVKFAVFTGFIFRVEEASQ